MVKNLLVNTGDVDLIPESERSRGEEMATSSSILAWEIPWTEETGELQSTGSQRVEHDSNSTMTVTTGFESVHWMLRQLCLQRK